MSFPAAAADERVLDVAFSDDALSVSLRAGRIITVPLAWYPRLLDATPRPAQGLGDCRRRLRPPLARPRRRPQPRRIVTRRARAEGSRSCRVIAVVNSEIPTCKDGHPATLQH
jgi:hypothetical protein